MHCLYDSTLSTRRQCQAVVLITLALGVTFLITGLWPMTLVVFAVGIAICLFVSSSPIKIWVSTMGDSLTLQVGSYITRRPRASLDSVGVQLDSEGDSRVCLIFGLPEHGFEYIPFGKKSGGLLSGNKCLVKELSQVLACPIRDL